MDVSSAATQLDLIKGTTNPSKAQAGEQKLADDFDAFLLLLTTQLKNQDPTEPLDTNEFTNQLVQFSIAEQAIQTNTTLEELIAYQNSGQLESALGYIGKAVDAKGNAGELSGGYGNFIYELDAAAATASVVITDGAGRAVFSGQGPTMSGKNRILWDGKNSFNGAQEPDGTYFVNVIAKSAAGETITSRTYTTGVVTSAEMKNGEMVLNVAGTSIKLSDINAVRTPVSYVDPNASGDDEGDDDTVVDEGGDDTVSGSEEEES